MPKAKPDTGPVNPLAGQPVVEDAQRLNAGDLEAMLGQPKLSAEAVDLELSGINRAMIQVRRDSNLTPAEKRKKLDGLTVERNNLLNGAVLDSKKAQRGRGFRPLEVTP